MTLRIDKCDLFGAFFYPAIRNKADFSMFEITT